MKNEFKKYLTNINMPTPLKNRAEEVYSLIESYLPEPVSFFIVTDHYDGENKQLFDNILIISEKYIAEARSFVNNTNFDLLGVNSLQYFHLSLQDYKVGEENPNSKVDLNIYINDSYKLQISATGNAVPSILKFVKKYVVPRVAVV